MDSSSRPSVTESTCSQETVEGKHLFKIEGYSLYSDLGVGEFIKSASFDIGGHEWCLKFYPNGYTEEEEEWVSVFISHNSKNTNVKALLDICLIDQTTRRPDFIWSEFPDKYKTMVEFRDETQDQGHDRFETKDDVKSYIVDDTLVIECNLLVIRFKEAEMKSVVQVPSSDLLDNLGDLLDTQDEADVSFEVKGEVFRAHKLILAMRSPVFKAELYGPMRDKCTGNVTIKDMEPCVFKALLHFIYKDSLPPMDDLNDDETEHMVKHILVVADRYAIERMKLLCECKLSASLSAKTVANTLALADQHHCTQLKDACIDFLNSTNRMDDVVESKGYEDLKRACPSIFADVWERAAKSRKK